MRIQAIYIRAFGGLADYSLRFPAGPTILYGVNERGKSTVLHFIRAMFYGLGDRRGSDNLRERFSPWDGSAMSGNIWFEHEGKGYELARSFGERKALDQVTLTDLDENRLIELENKEQPGAELFDMEEAVFADSLFVEAEGPGLSRSDEAKKALWESLTDVLVSPDDDVRAADITDRLRRAKLKLRSANGRRGELPELEAELSALEEQEQRFVNLQQEEAALSVDLSQWQEDLARLTAEEQDLMQKTEALRWQRDCRSLRLARAPLEQKQALEAEAGSLDAVLGKIAPDSARQLSRIEAWEKEGAALQSLEEELRIQQSEAASAAKQSERRVRLLALVSAAFSLLFFFLLLKQESIWLRALLAAFGLLLGVAALSLFFSRERWIKLFSGNQGDKAAQNEEAASKRRASYLEELKAAGMPEEDPSPEAFLRRLRSLREDRLSLSREIARLSESAKLQAEGLGGDFEAFGEKLEKQRAAFKADGLDPADVPDEDEAVIGRRLAEVRERLRLAERRSGECRASIERMLREAGNGESVSPAEQVLLLREKRRGLLEDIRRKERRLKALDIAEESLRQNLLDLRSEFLPLLAKRAGVYMERMSRGRYEKLSVDENFEILMKAKGSGHYYPPEKFSTGTEDQLYFAFRLALADHLAGGRSLPLLLDDAFINFDDKRTAEALSLLRERSEEAGGSQVLLFTCHRRLLKAAERAGWNQKSLPGR